MELRDLVVALTSGEALEARQWVADASHAALDWSSVEPPMDLTPSQMAVAAGIAELLAGRAGQPPPAWTNRVPASADRIVLVQAAMTMPRLLRLCEEEGPEPLRRRNILAPPDFLTAA
jgi:hypothetical protein